MENIPDSIQTIVDELTVSVTSDALIDYSGDYTVITFSSIDDPGFAPGMYIEFDGYPLRKQIVDITTVVNNKVLWIERYEAVEGGKIPFNIVLNYYYGNPKEIQARIFEMSTDTSQKRRKYPLLALFLDNIETIGENGYYFESSINMAFIIDCKLNWKPAERLTYSFKEKLYPIYELFLEKCIMQFGTNEWNKIEHTKTDRYFYSASPAKDQNTIGQSVDAIEINNFALKVRECN